MEKESKYFTEIREQNKDINIVKSAPIELEKKYGKETAEKIRKTILSNCTAVINQSSIKR